MFPREFLKTLVFGLALLVVAFAVVMGGAALAAAMGDAVLGTVLRGVGIGLVLLIVIDAVLLLVALGINELGRGARRRASEVRAGRSGSKYLPSRNLSHNRRRALAARRPVC